MDITFIVPCRGLAGGLRVVACYGNALIRRGHRVTVVYPHQERPMRDRLQKKIRRVLFHERDHLDFFRGRLLELPTLTVEHIPDGDVLIVTAFTTAVMGAELPERCGKKFYLIQGYEKVLANEGEDCDATFRLPFQKIVISTWLKTLVEELSGEADIPLIPNGRDFFLSTIDGEGLDRQYDLGVVYSSVLLKRTDVALNAIELLWERFPGLKVVMFGSQDPELNKYPKFSFDRVTFLRAPSPEQVRRTYLDTKVWMTASGTEGFCLPALEAISLGCPIVSSDNLGVNDIITHGVEGYIVPVGDPQALADRVAELLDDPRKRLRMSGAGLCRSDDFSWERSTELLEQLLISG